MVVQNCGWCKGPEADVTELSCLCENGYMNNEGTFISGNLVRCGQVLSKDDYEKHQQCKTCTHNETPFQCKWRQEHLSPATQPESHEEDDYFHFFVSSKGIATEVLEAFVRENGGEKGESAAGKLFKGEEGFLVTARFRFNSQDIGQLQELSERRRQGHSMTTESFARKSRSAHGQLNEFTHFVQGTIGRAPEVRAPPQQLLNPVQSDRQRSGRTVSNITHFKSQSDNNRREVKDSVPELTSAVRRVSVSDRSRQDIVASGIYTRRQDQDDASSDSTYQHSHRPYPEESAAGAHRRESHARHGDNQDEVSQRTTQSSTVAREPDKSSKPAPKTQARRKPIKQESGSDTDSEDTADVKQIKFFVPSEGLDLIVLAFYLRLCVDSNATVKQTNHKGKDGFILEAKRAVTIDEIADMKRDTKGWLSEKRGLSSSDTYVDSETAKQRRKKAGRKR